VKSLAFVIAICTLAMLAVHVSSWKLVEAWYDTGGSRLGRIFTPRHVLRGEAAYWILALAAWPLWRPLAMKVVVGTFAAIHIAAWLAGEMKRTGVIAGPADAPSRCRLATAIIAFDLIEALALVAVGWFAAMQTLS
jgi:hypothetical protein